VLRQLSISIALSSVKSVKEFSNELLLSLFVGFKLGVLLHVVEVHDFGDCYYSRAVLVKVAENFLHHFDFSITHRSSKSSKELFVADMAVTVNIIVLHEGLEVLLFGEHS